MPNSPHNPHSSADSLRSYLAGVLPDSQLTVEPVDSLHQPLLLLQTKHVMAGFAFSNGDMSKSYDALYGRFKTYFKESGGYGMPSISHSYFASSRTVPILTSSAHRRNGRVFLPQVRDSTYFPVWRVACTLAVSPAIAAGWQILRPASHRRFCNNVAFRPSWRNMLLSSANAVLNAL